MRSRLLVLMLALMAVVLLALGIPLARSQAEAQARAVYLDRLNDAARFASIAVQQTQSGEGRPLGTELARYQLVYGFRAALLDQSGAVVVASDADYHPLTPGAPQPAWLSAALGGRRAETPGPLWPWRTEPLIVAEPVISGGDVTAVVVIESSTATARAEVLLGLGILGTGELIAMIACWLLARRLTRWVLRPVYTVDQVAHAIATGQLQARVPVENGPAELRRLSSSFNDMADAVAGSLEQQRAFVADASHQLRNMLNALLLRMDDIVMRLPPGWEVDADGAMEDGRRLTQTLNRMLELARVEHGGHAATGPVDVAAAVDEQVEALAPVALSRSIRLDRAGAVRADGWAEGDAVGQSVQVVLDNAIKFSPPGSTVRVEVRQTDDGAEVVVTDSGEGLSGDELGQVGRRFWRSRRHQNVPGSGLGLAIAHTLLDRSGSRISFDPAPTGGLRVTIRIPAGPASCPPG